MIKIMIYIAVFIIGLLVGYKINPRNVKYKLKLYSSGYKIDEPEFNTPDLDIYTGKFADLMRSSIDRDVMKAFCKNIDKEKK